MFNVHPKHMAVTVLSRAMGGEVEEPEVDPKHAAAEEVIAAIEEKSPERLANALHSFVELCYGDEGSEF